MLSLLFVVGVAGELLAKIPFGTVRIRSYMLVIAFCRFFAALLIEGAAV